MTDSSIEQRPKIRALIGDEDLSRLEDRLLSRVQAEQVDTTIDSFLLWQLVAEVLSRRQEAAQERASRPSSADIEEAALWRAVFGCARMTAMGSAGIEKPNAQGYAHVTLNFWTHGERETDSYAREWLRKFAEAAKAVQAKGEG